MFRRFLKKQTKSISKWAIFSLFFSCFVLVISFGINTVTAVWHEPTATPAGDNIFGYINIGLDNQAKTGKLRLGSSDLTNFTYSLEVKGEAEMSQLIVDTFGSFGNTLYVNQQADHNVGIGKNNPTTKLEVYGGGVTVGKATPISDKAIEGYSSGETAIYGEASGSGEYYGVRGINDSNYGVWGVSDSGRGVYGKSGDESNDGGSGVMTEVSSEKYGIYGCSGWNGVTQSCSPNALAWAGYFSGRVMTENNDVVGKRFLPEKLQASLVPFTQGQTMSTKSSFEVYGPKDIAFDGQYLWVLRGGWPGTVSQYRLEDGVKIKDCTVGNSPLRMIYAAGYLWIANSAHGGGTTGDTISKIDPRSVAADCGRVDYPTKLGATNCTTVNGSSDNNTHPGCGPQDLVYDDITAGGPYIWTANYGDPNLLDSYLGTNSISKIKPSNPPATALIGTYLLQDSGSVMGVNPESITFDGTNIWTANRGIPMSDCTSSTPVTSADSVTKFLAADGSWLGTYLIETNAKPRDIVFDGVANVWTANAGTNKVAKINLDGTVAGIYLTGDSGTNRVMLDNITTPASGPYIWAANGGSVAKFKLDGTREIKAKLFNRGPVGITTENTYGSGANQYTYLWTANGYGRLEKTRSSDGSFIDEFPLQADSATGLAFDGANIWTANYAYFNSRSVSKVRAADGQRIANYNIIPSTWLDYEWLRGIGYDGKYIWVLHSLGWGNLGISKLRTSDGTVLINHEELSGTNTGETHALAGVISDNNTAGGPFLWMFTEGGSFNNESKLVRIFDNTTPENNTLDNVEKYGLGLNLQPPAGRQEKPKAMTFDGQNLWLVNSYDDSCVSSGGSTICDGGFTKCCRANLSMSCSTATDCDNNDTSSILKIVPSELNPSDPPAGKYFTNITATYTPTDIIFDGKYLWTANNGNGTVSKWLPNQDGTVTEVSGSPYPVNINGEKPRLLTFDGTYIWVAADRRPGESGQPNYMTILKASDGTKVNSFSFGTWIDVSDMIFDGSSVWLSTFRCGSGTGVYKFYSGSGYGQQAIEQVVRLQNIVPGYEESGNINISGSGTVGADAVVGANVSVTNNVWGGSSDSEVPVSVGGTANCGGTQNCFNCPEGYFVKDVRSEASTSSFGTGGVVWEPEPMPSYFLWGIAIDSGNMYLAGNALNQSRWLTEKRSLADGSLGYSVGGAVEADKGGDFAKDIAIDNSYMYLVGQYYYEYDPVNDPGAFYPYWRIEKRSLANGALVTSFGDSGSGTITVKSTAQEKYVDGALAVAIDNQYMYTVGQTVDNGGDWDRNWRIEKRRLDNGALCTGGACGADNFGDSGLGYIYNDPPAGSGGSSSADGIAIDATGGYMYVVGLDRNQNWRIEKRLLTTGALVSIFGQGGADGDGVITGTAQVGSILTGNGEIPFDIAVDNQYMYVVGGETVAGSDTQWRIEKRQLDTGALVYAQTRNIGSYEDTVEAVAIDHNYMYLVGWTAVNSGYGNGKNWVIEKRQLSDGNLATGFGDGGSGSITVTGGLWKSSDIAIDNTYMYVAGMHEDDWRIEKRRLSNGVLDNLPPNAITKLLCRPL